MMTCAPLTAAQDMKVLITEGIAKLCPPDLVPAAYGALKFCSAPGEPGTHCHYLLVGLQTTSETHMRLRDVFLAQLGFA